MKKNKRKSSLKSTLLLLLLTLILLISSSYAWFTSNRTVSISTIEVNVAASSGLQISADATIWKSVLTVDELKAGYAGHTNQLPSTLAPVSTDGTVGSGGLLNMYLGEVESTDGSFLLSTTKQTDKAGTSGYYVAFDIFLKVDTDSTLYLTQNSGVAASGENKGLQNAARIAFVNQGHSALGTAIATMQGLNKGTTSMIWEVNNNAHTAAAITNAQTYGLTIDDNDVINSYYGVKTEFTGEALNSKDTDKFAEVTPWLSSGVDGTNAKFADLTSGITKYRVYMWVEGQDVDCENSASGRSIKFDLGFSLDQE